MAPSGPTEYQAVLGLFVSVFVQLALLSVKLSQKPSASNVVEGSDESTGLPSIDQVSLRKWESSHLRHTHNTLILTSPN